MIVCELCTDDVNVHVVTKCNHNNICSLCIIKLRLKTGNERCPFCNALCDQIVLSDKDDIEYEDLDLANAIPYIGGLYFENQKVKDEVDEFNRIKCPIPKCPDNTTYNNINFLKKHIKERHNRYFCDICLEHRTLVFSEQRLFTNAQLDRHMKKGDIDDEGNVVFFHPYCKFCDKFFYDEEQLIKHLREIHYKCDICDQDRKFFFYNKYDNLEIHYNLSHYLCQDQICRKSHTVFKSAPELDHHTTKYHADKANASANKAKNINQNLLMSMTNFNYGNISDYSKSQAARGEHIKDREGADFEPQILSQRKFHTKFHTEKDVSGEEKFDFRRYFPKNQIKEFHIEEYEIPRKSTGTTEEAHAHEETEQHYEQHYEHYDSGSYRGYRGRRGRGGRGGRGGGGRGGYLTEKHYNVRDPLENQEITVEHCNMANFMTLAMTRDELFAELGKVLNETDKKALQSKVTDYYKGRINEASFFDSWITILGKRLTLTKAFPFFIASCEREDTCKVLDQYYYQQILKLPKKHDALVYEFVTYNDFFKRLYTEIENNIVKRIQNNQIDYKEKFYQMDTHRILQLIQIIKRLSIADMASFKFAINFGLNPKTKEIINDLLLNDKRLVQDKLSQIPEQEIFILLKYIELCKVKLAKSIENISLSKLSKNLLESVFALHPDIKAQFEKELGKEGFKNLVEKKFVEFEEKPFASRSVWDRPGKKNVEERKEEAKSESFDSKNKFEFPNIKDNNKIPLPPTYKNKKITGANDGWEKTQDPYSVKSTFVNRDAELKKKVAEDFPTLAKDAKNQDQAAYWDKLNKPTAKPIAGDWGKTSSKQEEFYQETDQDIINDMVIGEKKGKKAKGNKKVVYLTGGFK